MTTKMFNKQNRIKALARYRRQNGRYMANIEAYNIKKQRIAAEKNSRTFLALAFSLGMWVMFATSLPSLFNPGLENNGSVSSVVTKAPGAPVSVPKPLGVAWEVPTKESFVAEVKASCARNGLGSKCPVDLLAMKRVESGTDWDCGATVGDVHLKNKSYGCFQIRPALHGITEAQARDFRFAIDWTIKNMKRNGYGTSSRAWAVGSHNSKTPSVNAKYYAAVASHEGWVSLK